MLFREVHIFCVGVLSVLTELFHSIGYIPEESKHSFINENGQKAAVTVLVFVFKRRKKGHSFWV